MIPVILESPYAGNVQRNKAYLQLCILDCVARDYAPFASHQMYTDALNDLNPTERKQGIEAGLVWGALAQRMVVYTDFGISTGMEYGIERAQKEGRQVERRRILSDSEVILFYTEQDAQFDTSWEELLARWLGR